jgi:peptidoglycan hydrolase-like protein with peptidoglycan-binding domain
MVNAATAIPIFPGHTIGLRDPDTQSTVLIQRRINQVGCGPVAEDGDFGPQTQEAVELFQTRAADHFGLPLAVDGSVGPLTWASLFAVPEVPTVQTAPAPLLAATLKFAATQIGVMEQPLGSNRGPEVDEYLRSVGIDPTTGSFPWCAAFVYFCFRQAAIAQGVANPVIQTGGVLDHWNRAGAAGIRRLGTDECIANPSLVTPGLIFIIINKNGSGHTGLVEAVTGTYLTTIEGNTNDNGSREGVGVFRRQKRTIASISRGYISY